MAATWSIKPNTNVTASTTSTGDYEVTFGDRTNLSATAYTITYTDNDGKCGKFTVNQLGGSTPPPGNRVRLKTLTINNNTGEELYILEYFRIYINSNNTNYSLHIYTQYAKNNTYWISDWKTDQETGRRECDMSAGNTTSEVLLPTGPTVYKNIECAADPPLKEIYEGKETCEGSGGKYQYSDPRSITGKTTGRAYVMTVSPDNTSWYKDGLICSANVNDAFNADGNDNLTITIDRICIQGSDTDCVWPAHHKNPADSSTLDPHTTEN